MVQDGDDGDFDGDETSFKCILDGIKSNKRQRRERFRFLFKSTARLFDATQRRCCVSAHAQWLSLTWLERCVAFRIVSKRRSCAIQFRARARRVPASCAKFSGSLASSVSAAFGSAQESIRSEARSICEGALADR